MFGRIWKYVSNNALLATVVGGLVVAGLVALIGAWKGPDLGAAFRATSGWFAADVSVSRGVALAILLGYIVASLGLYMYAAGHWLKRMRERAVEDYKRSLAHDDPPAHKPVAIGAPIALVNDRPAREPRQATPHVNALPSLPMPTEELPGPPAKFAPETFQLNAQRARALLMLVHRIDEQTTLDELLRMTNAHPQYIVKDPTTKARLQRDMEDAERAGIVDVERIGLSHYYSLTIPAGRDWLLERQAEISNEAQKGLTRRDPRSPQH
jgi:hypothetical protein